MTQIKRDHSERLVGAVSWSPDGARLVTASRQQSLRGSHSIADAEPRGGSPVESAVQADRASERQGGATVWDVDTGVPLLSYRGHPHGANDVAWAPDGRCVASGRGPDRTAQGWDADSGRPLITYPSRAQGEPAAGE